MANCSSCGSTDITININPRPTGFSSYPIESYTCNSCNSTYSTGTCTECDSECTDMTNTSCSVYNGEDLPNIGAITNDNLNNVLKDIDEVIGGVLTQSNTILVSKVTIKAADVTGLHTTPATLIAAPGADKYLNILSITATVSNSATPYSPYNILSVYINGATYNLYSASDALVYTDGRIHFMKVVTNNSNVLSNAALMAKTDSPDPSGGDGDLVFYITYQIINL